MTKTMMTAGLGAVLALGLSACGSGDGPEDAVEEFANAAADKDYSKVCEMLDPEFVKTVESAGVHADPRGGPVDARAAANWDEAH